MPVLTQEEYYKALTDISETIESSPEWLPVGDSGCSEDLKNAADAAGKAGKAGEAGEAGEA